MRKSIIYRGLVFLNLFLLCVFCIYQWNKAFSTKFSAPNPTQNSAEKIAEQIRNYPDDSRCVVIKNIPPWQPAYDAAPRLLYYRKGEADRVSDFLTTFKIDCVIVFLGSSKDGVFRADALK